jgi:serine O-acetyltransferase
MATVIGETAIIGDDVLIYHGVTLGSKTGERGKRHPTIGNNVVLGAQSLVIGNISVGDGATVGAATLVVRDVAPNTTVVGNPAQIL